MSESGRRPAGAAAIGGNLIRAATVGMVAGCIVAFLFAVGRWRGFWLWVPSPDHARYSGPSLGTLSDGLFSQESARQFSQIHLNLLMFVLLMAFAGGVGGVIGFVVCRKRGTGRPPPVAQMWTPNSSTPGT